MPFKACACMNSPKIPMLNGLTISLHKKSRYVFSGRCQGQARCPLSKQAYHPQYKSNYKFTLQQLEYTSMERECSCLLARERPSKWYSLIKKFTIYPFSTTTRYYPVCWYAFSSCRYLPESGLRKNHWKGTWHTNGDQQAWTNCRRQRLAQSLPVSSLQRFPRLREQTFPQADMLHRIMILAQFWLCPLHSSDQLIKFWDLGPTCI